jgi:hypothetical protein
MVVVKLVVKVLVAESHGGETMIEKEKTGGVIFCQMWPLISPPSGDEIHIYL